VERIEAKAQWNILKPRTTETQTIRLDLKELYLRGTDLQLKPGDMLLIEGDERWDCELSENWDARIVLTVRTDADRSLTLGTGQEGLGRRKSGKTTAPAKKNAKVFVMHQRPSLFGQNAPDPRIMKIDDTSLAAGSGANREWVGFAIDQANRAIDLAATYPKILDDAWLLLSKPGLVDDSYMELYRNQFALRDATVYAQSEELQMAEVPLTTAEKGSSVSVKLVAG
jgi:hypothetical protein